MAIQIQIPKQAALVLDMLEAKGYEAFVVGGCVRDSIIGRTPKDWDVCTSALPEDILEVFKDCETFPTGLKHGTVTVIVDVVPIEITTYRIDGDYSDNRRPNRVEFTSNLKRDLERRDFTINAMAYNPKSGLVDLWGGLKDIREKTIRCVGNADIRFKEDALRILRAVRFAGKYGFKIEDSTLNAAIENKELLKNLSIERVNSEITQFLEFSDFYEEGFNCFKGILPEAELITYFLVFLDVITEDYYSIDLRKVSERIRTSFSIPELRLAIIFDTPMIKDILKKLRFSNEVINKAAEIWECGNCIIDKEYLWNTGFKKDILYYARKLISKTKSWRLAICFAEIKDKSINLEKLITVCNNSYFHEGVYNLSTLKINGNDLIDVGYKGESIGRVLHWLLDAVMKGDLANEKATLMRVACRWLD